MRLKSFFNYNKPNSFSNDSLVFLHVKEIKNMRVVLQKTYIENRQFNLFFKRETERNDANNKCHRTLPYIVVEHIVELKQLQWLLDCLDINIMVEANTSVETINNALSGKAIVRNNVRYEIINCKTFVSFKKLYQLWKGAKQYRPEDFRFSNELQNEGLILRLFNVGQANCSILFSKKDERGLVAYKPFLIFDLGCARNNPHLFKELYSIDNADIIVSHFDSDHINIGKKLFKSKHNKINIFYPSFANFDSLSITAQIFLIGSILNDYNLFPLNLGRNDLIKMNNLEIYQGQDCKALSQTITRINQECLIAYLKREKTRLLIPGDAIYDNFPVKFNPTHLIVPHHACKYPFAKLPNLEEKDLQKVHVYCGIKNKYGHPNSSHLEHFRKTKVSMFTNSSSLHDKSKDYDTNKTGETFKRFIIPIDGESEEWSL